MASFKRARSPATQDISPSPSPASSPTLKAARTSATPPPLPSTSTASSHNGIICTLPPTCNPPHRPTALSGTRELEAHYAMYHAHVCEQRGCGCVFPDARFLELHQTECHDPLAAVRKERGEKIFGCFLATCDRIFSTPKTRRLHLIQAHGYPKEFYFAVTNRGVGGLLKRWGEGASMLRKPWRSRENGAAEGEDEDENDDDQGASSGVAINVEPNPAHAAGHTTATAEEDGDEEDQIVLEKIQIERAPAAARIPSVQANYTMTHAPHDKPEEPQFKNKGKGKEKQIIQDGDVDTLTTSLDSLSLVPTSIQFGRGAKRGALQDGGSGRDRRNGGRGHARRGSAGKGVLGARGTGANADDFERMDVDSASSSRGRGQGRRGGFPIPRAGAIRAMTAGRGRGGPRGGAVLGMGGGRGMGPGRGVSRE